MKKVIMRKKKNGELFIENICSDMEEVNIFFHYIKEDLKDIDDNCIEKFYVTDMREFIISSKEIIEK